MPAALLDPALAYLRKQCGLPTKPATMLASSDPDNPAERLLTTAEAARAAHVRETTIRDWAADYTRTGGRPPLLHAAARDPRGWPLYRELDVLTVEAQTRRTARAEALAREAMQGLDAPIT